jgi:CRISPR-associated protein Csb2
MSSLFCLTVRFLDPVPSFHGRGDDGEPEWPPSPLRLFQALVAASAARWRGNHFADYAQPALKWLEERTPTIAASSIQFRRTGYRMYVPNNAGDLVTLAWARGSYDAKFSQLNVEKDVLPSRMSGGDCVHFLWDLPNPVPSTVMGFLETLTAAARSITHLGWGIDMVAGNAAIITKDEAAKLPGERWSACDDSSTRGYRVPIVGSLDDLMKKHNAFLKRLDRGGFKPVPPLSAFRVVGYRRATDSAPCPAIAFEIWKPLSELAELPAGKSKFRPFDTPRRMGTVAGMARHTASVAAKSAGWAQDRIDTFILGHGEGKETQAVTNDRLMYLPLPSITPLKVESIRRLLVVGPPGCKADMNRMRQLLSGQELTPNGSDDPIAMLSVIPTSDRNVERYVKPAVEWATVTPVVLPGYDDPGQLRRRLSEPTDADEQKRLLGRMDARIEGLLRKAIRQAGFSDVLAAKAEIDWRSVGFMPGLDLASKYLLPKHLQRFSRYHVKIIWRDAEGNPISINGPIAIGGGRFGGFGLFAAMDR